MKATVRPIGFKSNFSSLPVTFLLKFLQCRINFCNKMTLIQTVGAWERGDQLECMKDMFFEVKVYSFKETP